MAPVEDEDDDVVILLLEGKTRKLFVRLNSSSFNEGDLVLWRKGDQHITISPLSTRIGKVAPIVLCYNNSVELLR